MWHVYFYRLIYPHSHSLALEKLFYSCQTQLHILFCFHNTKLSISLEIQQKCKCVITACKFTESLKGNIQFLLPNIISLFLYLNLLILQKKIHLYACTKPNVCHMILYFCIMKISKQYLLSILQREFYNIPLIHYWYFLLIDIYKDKIEETTGQVK